MPPPIGSASPFRPRSRGSGRQSPSPPPPPLPPKSIDLNSSTASVERATGSKVIRRAFVCDVVVERDGEETTTLLSQLGRPLDPLTALPQPPQPPLTPSRKSQGDDDSYSGWSANKKDEMERRLQSLIEELVRTERSYVSRIKALKTSYADPLRHFAKQGYSVIIPAYEAKILFSNIDAVLPAAQTFLNDLEEMWASGQAENLVGDVCLRHLKTIKTLDPYRTYIGNQDEAQKTFQEMFKKVNTFVSFIESTKYQTTGIGNIGLRELLMEPVQRVPRYTLLWQSMAKCMSPLSDQRTKLLDATEIASRIARCEADEQTVRATVQYCLQRNVEGFPANLFSNNRNFVDSIDAEDVLGDAAPGSARHSRQGSMMNGKMSTPTLNLGGLGSPTADNGAVPALHCTLFLFDDKLLITKRVSSTVSGRKVTGLDDVRALVKSGGGVAVREKDGTRKEKLSFRGAVDIEDVVAMDMGNGDFQLFLDLNAKSDALADQVDKWSAARTLRQYSTIHPPHPIGFDPVTSRKDKLRFVHNIWAAQALRRTKLKPAEVKPVPRGVLACTDEIDLDKELLRVKAYWNLWDRAGWVGAQEKAKVVIQIAEDEDIPELPLPQESGPTLIIRLEPMPGAVCKLQAVTNTGTQVYRTASSLGEINKKIIEAINAGGLFKVKASHTRASSFGGGTPGSMISKRASRVFGSDGIARNLWGGSTSSTRGGYSGSDGFGSSSTKRSQSIKSRSSTLTRASTDMTSISSSGRSAPKSPKSPSGSSFSDSRSNSDSSIPMSPIKSPVKAEPDTETDNLDARLNLARYNSRSMVALTSTPSKPPTPVKTTTTPMVSRVAAMREQLERKMTEGGGGGGGIEETLSTLSSITDSGMSPVKGRALRGPVPTLASSVIQTEGGISRDSSMGSLHSPTRHGTLSRSGTLSPRGPRTPSKGMAARSGYVPPLPPPIPTAERSPVVATIPLAQPDAEASSSSDPTMDSEDYVDLTDLSTTGHEPVRYTLHDPPVGYLTSTALAVQASVSATREASPQRSVRALPPSPSPEPPAHRPIPSPRHSVNAVPARLLGLGAPPKQSPRGGRSTSNPPCDENSPTGGSPHKRQHAAADYLSPRKRSTSDSPMARQVSDGTATSEHQSRPTSVLGPASGGRRTSGISVAPRANRRSSAGAGVLSPSRHVSTASTMTVQSFVSTTDDHDIVMSDHAELPTAADSTRQRVADARKLARRIRIDTAALKKTYTVGIESRSPMMPRSPQTLNIQNVLSVSDDSPTAMAKADVEMEDLMLSILGTGDKLEQKLAAALADSERVRMLARTTAEAEAQSAAGVAMHEGQLARAKERETLLSEQLHRRDLEVEEIYNAFNAELDGMYNDMTLPQPDAALAAMRRDLQETKAKRNAYELENNRLRMQLEEERLKREQWHKMLHARGLLP